MSLIKVVPYVSGAVEVCEEPAFEFANKKNLFLIKIDSNDYLTLALLRTN